VVLLESACSIGDVCCVIFMAVVSRFGIAFCFVISCFFERFLSVFCNCAE